MKRVFSAILIIVLMLLNVIPAAASETSIGDTTIQCDVDTVKVVLNEKEIQTGAIRYNQETYIRIHDAIHYFNATLRAGEKKNEINIIPLKGKSVIRRPVVKRVPQQNVNIRAGVNTYVIKYSGFNEFIDTIEYRNSVYVNVRYFVEMFGKKASYETDGSVTIKDIPNPFIGSVNGENIAMTELAYFYNPNAMMLEGQSGIDVEKEKEKLKQDIFNYLVTRKIVLQKANQGKVQLSVKEIDIINSQIMVQTINEYGGVASFRKELERYDLSLHQVIFYFRDSYLYNKTMEHYLSEIEASDDKVKAFYQEHQDNYSTPEKVTAKHILVLTMDAYGNSLSVDQKAEAKKKAEDILDRLNKGEDFDQLMNTYSEDPGSKQYPQGYTFGRGEMVREFEDTAFSLKPGEISGIVETAYGYHIIKLVEKIPAKTSTYEEVKDEIKAGLDQIEKQTYNVKLIETWTEESKIVNQIK